MPNDIMLALVASIWGAVQTRCSISKNLSETRNVILSGKLNGQSITEPQAKILFQRDWRPQTKLLFWTSMIFAVIAGLLACQYAACENVEWIIAACVGLFHLAYAFGASSLAKCEEAEIVDAIKKLA